jgi:hypothetical protein
LTFKKGTTMTVRQDVVRMRVLRAQALVLVSRKFRRMRHRGPAWRMSGGDGPMMGAENNAVAQAE